MFERGGPHLVDGVDYKVAVTIYFSSHFLHSSAFG